MNSENDITPMELYSGNPIEAGMIQSLLEENGVPAFVHNNHMGTLEPWVVAAGGLNPVKVIVASTDYERARKLLDDFNSAENELSNTEE